MAAQKLPKKYVVQRNGKVVDPETGALIPELNEDTKKRAMPKRGENKNERFAPRGG